MENKHFFPRNFTIVPNPFRATLLPFLPLPLGLFVFLSIISCTGIPGAPEGTRKSPGYETAAAPWEEPDMFPSLDDMKIRWRAYGNSGIQLISVKITEPPLEFWALKANLADPRISILVGPGNSSPGTVLSTKVSSFAEEYECAAAVNANPFAPSSGREGEERQVVGIAVAEGRRIAPADDRYAALVFYPGARAEVKAQAELGDLEAAMIVNAVGGFFVVLEDGTERGNDERRHPRTAAGLGEGGTALYLLVVDGRRSESRGATERETGRILSLLGARDGLILDGGGSTALALREVRESSPELGSVRLANVPVHGLWPGAERAVATCLGIRVGAPPPEAEAPLGTHP